MRSMILMAFVGAFSLVAGLGNSAQASDLASCAQMKDDAERLACYDLLAKELLSPEARLAKELLSPEAREATPDASDEAAEREKIISRCREEMGEHGSAMVKYCAEEDIAAYRALQGYSAELHPFVERCIGEMGRHGWSMVKYCADEDIDAERALSDMLVD